MMMIIYPNHPRWLFGISSINSLLNQVIACSKVVTSDPRKSIWAIFGDYCRTHLFFSTHYNYIVSTWGKPSKLYTSYHPRFEIAKVFSLWFPWKYQGQNSKNSTKTCRIQHEEAVRAFEQKRSQRELLGFVVQMLELQET